MIRFYLKFIPNVLTLSRLPLAALFPLYYEKYSSLIVLLALITEFLDGFLSRKFHWTSLFGQIMDPIADKIFFTTVIVTLWWKKELEIWQILALSIREIVVLTGVLLAYLFANHTKQKKELLGEMRPHFFGKATTTLQYGVFFNILFWPPLHPYILLLATLSGILASFSYIQLFLQKINLMGRRERPKI